MSDELPEHQELDPDQEEVSIDYLLGQIRNKTLELADGEFEIPFEISGLTKLTDPDPEIRKQAIALLDQMFYVEIFDEYEKFEKSFFDLCDLVSELNFDREIDVKLNSLRRYQSVMVREYKLYRMSISALLTGLYTLGTLVYISNQPHGADEFVLLFTALYAFYQASLTTLNPKVRATININRLLETHHKQKPKNFSEDIEEM